MATLIPECEDEVRCSECDAIFQIIWRRSIDIIGITFCPFCGDYVEMDD